MKGWTCASMSLDAIHVCKPSWSEIQQNKRMRMCLNDTWLINDFLA